MYGEKVCVFFESCFGGVGGWFEGFPPLPGGSRDGWVGSGRLRPVGRFGFELEIEAEGRSGSERCWSRDGGDDGRLRLV